MSGHPTNRLRLLAALLITLSGVTLVASLWQRSLNATALFDALLGATYLIIGIGLYGRSRFSLAMATFVPLAAAAWVVASRGLPDPLYVGRLALDCAVATCSAAAWWQGAHAE